MSNIQWKNRVLREMAKWQRESKEEDYMNIKLFFNEEKLDTGYAVVYCINEESPFWGLPLYFKFTIPNTYPHTNPGFSFVSPLFFGTGVKTCRIHPNLYETGKVCLSILGTWSGDPWKPCCTILTTVKTIESLLHDNPIICEPGNENHAVNSLPAKEYYLNSLYRSMYIVTNMLEKVWNNDKSINELPFIDWCVDKILAERGRYIDRIKDLECTISEKILHSNCEERNFPELLERFIKLVTILDLERKEKKQKDTEQVQLTPTLTIAPDETIKNNKEVETNKGTNGDMIQNIMKMVTENVKAAVNNLNL
jgi:ubiquitin-protein ligase